MVHYHYTHFFAFSAICISSSLAQAPSCSSTLSQANAAPSVAPGYAAVLVANGLTHPRGIKFDSAGRLLVVEQGKGITALSLGDDNGSNCPQSQAKLSVVNDTTLNHGLELQSTDQGTYLYASSTSTVFRWTYAIEAATASDSTVVVNNMTGTDHTTRTLLFSKKNPKLLLVSRGSLENLDPTAAVKADAISQIKSFNIADESLPQDYPSQGDLLGWGLRNDVGIDEHPSGLIYSVENSADEITRTGVNIHQDNPGEELNFLGSVSQSNVAVPQGLDRNYGYPYCFAAWNTTAIPNYNGSVGQQFAIDGPNDVTLNDTYCEELVAPRLTFQAHMAPLDILFNSAGTAAWVTFHGSWDRTAPVGYKLSTIDFNTDGQPVAPSTSTTAAIDIVSNQDNSQCPDHCFRPVGLAFDSKGRLFMSSDSTGEIFAIIQTDGNATSTTGSNGSTSTASSSAVSTPTSGSSSTSVTSIRRTSAQATSSVVISSLTPISSLLEPTSSLTTTATLSEPTSSLTAITSLSEATSSLTAITSLSEPTSSLTTTTTSSSLSEQNSSLTATATLSEPISSLTTITSSSLEPSSSLTTTTSSSSSPSSSSSSELTSSQPAYSETAYSPIALSQEVSSSQPTESPITLPSSTLSSSLAPITTTFVGYPPPCHEHPRSRPTWWYPIGD